MSPERNASSAPNTPSIEANRAASSTTTGKQADSSKEKALEAPAEPQTKSKSKRPLSTSLSPPHPKRPAMESTKTLSSKTSWAYTDLSPSWLPDDSSQATSPKTLQLTYHVGDIFTAPPRTLLIHACNTQGHWGAGIAKAFKTIYPKGYLAHHKFCAKEHSKTSPVPTGTAQLIAPMDADGDEGHWIGCVFTSAKYGRAKDKPDAIVKNTGESMRMLLELVKMADEERGDGKEVGTIRMCKINSGKFGVPWEKTEEVLKEIVLKDGWRRTVEVWEPVEG